MCRRVVARTDWKYGINCVYAHLQVILYWLVTNSGGHFELSGDHCRPLWEHPCTQPCHGLLSLMHFM